MGVALATGRDIARRASARRSARARAAARLMPAVREHAPEAARCASAHRSTSSCRRRRSAPGPRRDRRAVAGARRHRALDRAASRPTALRGVASRAGVRRVLRRRGYRLRVRAADRALDRVRRRRDGHGLDADHDRVHRRDRRPDGHQAAVAAITARAMRGEIDFRESLGAASRCWPGCRRAALEQVYDERLRLSPGAERMLDGIQGRGAKLLLVSGGFTFFTDRLETGSASTTRCRTRSRSSTAR